MPARADLTGQTFGKWKVIEYVGNRKWRCQCSCEKHTIRDVNTQSLTKGTSLSCGCYQDRSVKEDLSGRQFGEWHVLRYVGDGKYLCRCSCENHTEKLVDRQNLILGKTKSCGCKRRELGKHTLLDRYRETSSVKVGIANNREEWQINTFENPELLKEYILNNWEYTPTYSDVANKLGVTRHSISRRIHEYGLENLIDINSLQSEEEKELLEFIESLGVKTIHGDRQQIAPYELDIYIPEKKIAIEFNGNYWHSDEKINKNYHQNKSLKCIANGIRLIHIFEYEWIPEDNKEKIKNFLKSAILGNEEIVYARNTYIKEVEYNQALEFINKYHLQGYAGASIKIGCFNKETKELIGMMTFGIPRFTSEYEYELVRLCYKNNTCIIGGAEKMLKYFIDRHKPKSILSYCDISKFDGKVYTRLGFEKDKERFITEPNYIWVDPNHNTVLPRYKTQKQKLIDQGLGKEDQTEVEIMKCLNYNKVYNSGNFKFVMVIG